MAVKIIFLTTTGPGTWTVPADWSNTNKIECIGAGGGGRTAAVGGGGGGGGAHNVISANTNWTPGQVVDFSVGAGGPAGVAGGDTWFGATTFAASNVGAKGGSGATSATGAAGGNKAAGIPTAPGNSGGAGGNGNTVAGIETGGGGGGAASGAGTGGLGGNGDTTAAGSDYGGGGGSGAGSTTAGGAGGAGTTSAGAGGTNASGGGPGGAGGQGAGVTPTAATGMWTSTHAPDSTTPSVAGAAAGGGGGGAGSAAGAPGNGSKYGGGGGGAGITTGGASTGGQGLIVITYTTLAAPINASATQTTALPTQSATGTVPGGLVTVTGAQTTALPTQAATGTVPSSGGGGGWTPLNLAGCKALYTAKDAASVGTTWLDQTSNHYDLAVISGSPTFDANAFGAGEPGFVLDGVDDVFVASGISTNTDKIWGFARIIAERQPGNNDRIITLPVPGGFRDFDANACGLLAYFGNAPFEQVISLREGAATGTTTNDPDSVILGTSAIYGAIYNGTTCTGYLRDTAQNSGASSGIFGPTNFLVLGSAQPNTFINGANYRIMALAFGVGDLTGAEITQIVGWLDNPVMAAAGPAAVNVTGAQTTALPAQAATASIIIPGLNAGADQTTGLPSQAATAAARVAAAATQTTALPTQAATAAARAAAQATQSTAFPTQVATAAARVTGTATQATALPTQLALASLPLSGLNYAALQATDLPVQTATARARVSASSAQVLAFPTQVAAATVVPMTSHLFVNHNGVWKPATTWVNHAGTWKRPAHIYVNDAGVWKEVA